MRRKKQFIIVLILLLFISGNTFPARIKPAHLFGKVVINNFSADAGIAPVVFDHWLHRAKFTCRLCHIEIGFAMDAGVTRISADTNSQGYYCGACHDGKRVHEGKSIFKACGKEGPSGEKRCKRCHSKGDTSEREYVFEVFTEKLPRLSMGAIDWEGAEKKGLIAPVDFLEGLSFQRTALKAQDDFSIDSKAGWMSDVIFSHKKHAAWNGCELCHPEIFPSTKKGTVKYSMFQIFNNRYCGVCHGRVAFSLFLCHKCHIKPVR